MTIDILSRPAGPDAATATDRESWLARIDEIGEDAGYTEPLGPRHWAFFVDESPVLLVTFETMDGIRAAHPSQMPLGARIAAEKGWSCLCLIAEGETFFRDPAVYGYFDRLVDDAFFEDFDHVVFHGTGMAGYAACAYSVAAPGATVLAVTPRATLDRARAPWDPRHPALRRTDFATRYGYAPDMTEGTGEVFVLFDPAETLDAMHASLFRGSHITHLRCPGSGAEVQHALDGMGILTPLIHAAMEQRLDRHAFARLWRARREHKPWLLALLARVEATGKLGRLEMLCRAVTTRLNHRAFRRKLRQIEAHKASGNTGPMATGPDTP